MTKFSVSILAVVLGLVATAASAPPYVPPKPAALPSSYEVRLQVKDKAGKPAFLKVAEITRTNGAVSTKTFPVPEIDSLGTSFVADWNAYKHPAKVTITESHPEHTGMSPQYKAHTFTFTPSDPLYKAAVIRDFLHKRGYQNLGINLIDFIVYDRSAEYPPGAHDRASTLSNFRKGTQINWSGDAISVWVRKSVRPTRAPGRGRVSASDKTAFLAAGHDDGTVEIARMTLYKDGRITVVPITAAESFQSAFGTFDPKRDIEISTVGSDEYETWTSRVIPKTSPQLLEAHLLVTLEYRRAYQVLPVIDPQQVK